MSSATRSPGRGNGAAGTGTTVGVFGGGSWGCSIAHLLAEGGSEVLLWLRDPRVAESINRDHVNPRYLPDSPLNPRVRATDDARELCRAARLLFVVVPSQSFRAVLRDIGEHLQGDHLLVSATKGFEIETFRRMSELIREETCVRRLGVLSGPNISREILAGQPAATVIASHYQDVIETVSGLLHSSRFRVYWSDDVVGAEVGGALKNVIAICSGLADGMGFGDNTRAMLITRGLAEMARLGAVMGAAPLTFSGLAGVGDLIVTCSSVHSRNFRVGHALGEGASLEEAVARLGAVAEGVHTARAVMRHASRLGVDLPLTEGVHRILFEGMQPRHVLEDLMGREARYEIDHVVSARR